MYIMLMFMETIRVGIIGAGNIGNFHAKVLREVDGAILSAVADTNTAAARGIAEQYGCRAFSDYREMLSLNEVDLVSVCLPPALHYNTAVDIARAGKHILMEKPMDVSSLQAKKMIDECKRLGVKLGIISQHRFDPVIRILWNLICQGRLGKRLYGTAKVIWYRESGYYKGGGTWRGLKINQGGVLMAHAIHYIDLLQYLMGEVESVQSLCRTLLYDIEVEDTGLALLRFKNGAIGSIEATTAAYPGLMAELCIYTDKATVRVKDDKLEYYASTDGSVPELEALLNEKKAGLAAVADPMSLVTSAHRDQYLDMMAAIRENREPLVNGREGMLPISLIEAMYRASDRQDGWVTV
jgi:predicted dehydrogenase